MQNLAPDDHAPIPFIDRYNVLKLFSLIFKDQALEQHYSADYAGKVSGQARLALLLAFVLYVNFAYLDYLLVPESMFKLWAIRAVTCSIFVIAFAVTYSKIFTLHHQLFLMLSSFSTASGIFAMLLITRNEVNHYYYEGINLCITWTLFIVGLRFFNALWAVLIIIVAYNIIAFYKHLLLPEVLSNNFFLMSNAIIGIFAGYTIEQHSRWQFYQSLVIKNNSSKLHQAMLSASVESVITVDDTGSVIEFNQSAETIFGYSRQEVIGQAIGKLIVPEHLRAGHDAGFKRFVASGEKRILGLRLELDAMRKDGSIFPVEITLREINLIGRRLVTAYIRDLTAQRNAEKELIRQREILQSNEKLSALGALLAGVAHELNNPLSVVLGQAQLLKETEQDHRVLNRAEKICRAADRCAKVVSTFLSMARHKPPQRTNVNLNEVIKDAVDLLDYGLRSRGVKAVLQLHEALPLLHADSDQLHQVITNLVLNAQHAMQNCAIRCLTLRTSLSEARNMIHLEIMDTGPGVPIDLRRRVFEPFFTTKPMGVGTGLGLSVCNGIVEAHGGSIEILENAEAGACFAISLPISEYQEAQQSENFSISQNIIQQCILVVDDEPEILEMISEILRNAGHEVICANNGNEVLTLLETSLPHVILSDFRMPAMNGAELFSAVVERWPYFRDHFIFMTGDVLTVDNTNFLRIVNCPILEKPFSPPQLLGLVASLVTRGELIA